MRTMCRMGGESRYEGGEGIGHRLELLPPQERHRRALQVMRRIEVVSRQPPSRERSAALAQLRTKLERLCS